MTEDSGKARMILGCILLVLTAALAIFLIYKPPSDEFVKAQLTIILGVFIAKLGDMFVFYFGTSSGAKTLSAAQAEIAKSVASGTGTGGVTVVSEPNKVTVAPAPPAPSPAPAPEPMAEDPWLTSLRVLMKQINPDVTEAQIMAAYRQARPLDVSF